MKNQNKLLLILTIVTTTTMPYYGRGGGAGTFVGGMATGALITAAATRGNRAPQDSETVRTKSIDRRIRQKETALRRAEKRGDEKTAERLRKEISDLDAQL